MHTGDSLLTLALCELSHDTTPSHNRQPPRQCPTGFVTLATLPPSHHFTPPSPSSLSPCSLSLFSLLTLFHIPPSSHLPSPHTHTTTLHTSCTATPTHASRRAAASRLLILARFVQPAPSSRRSSRSFWGSRRTASSASTSGRWCRGWRKSSTSCAQRRGSLGKGIAIDEYFAFALLGLCTRIHAFTHSTTSSAPIPVSALRVSKHHSHSYFHFHFPLTV